VVPSCTMITCAANELVRPIHDRGPVVLASREAWQAWLDPPSTALPRATCSRQSRRTKWSRGRRTPWSTRPVTTGRAVWSYLPRR